jgi:hypothetical protein
LVLSSERQLQYYYCGGDLKEEDAALLFPGREDKRGAFYLSFAVEIESYRFPKNAPVLLCNLRHIFWSGRQWISCSRKSLSIPRSNA